MAQLFHLPADPADVAGHFSRAEDYSCHDVLQRKTSAKLKAGFALRGALLDLGAGPGTEFDTGAISRITTLDLAFGMCQRLRQRFPDITPICGDARQLPFADGVFDCIYSNLALQWCQPLEMAIAELARVVKPGGGVAIALVCDGSVPELESLGFSVNHFIDAGSAAGSFNLAHWQDVSAEVVTETLHFADLRSLIYSIKGVGANARQDAGSAAKLRGRQDWLERVARAEASRTPEGIPLSYQILYLFAIRREEFLP